ncbi:hypothetical protein ANO14919_048900 [Xylariales sp. No.14919]|nr:hypothetical protein ANO14919_048900 [Xylariales sp. No.14919]
MADSPDEGRRLGDAADTYTDIGDHHSENKIAARVLGKIPTLEHLYKEVNIALDYHDFLLLISPKQQSQEAQYLHSLNDH